MADNLKLFGTTYYDVPGLKVQDVDGNEKTFIRPAGTKQIFQNGTADVKNYEQANVNVPNSYDAGDEGKVVQDGALVSQSSQNINSNGTYNTTTSNQAIVAVPNTYTAGDEGKVVNNGVLQAQGSDTVTDNDTYDTTLINSLTVNVSGGGGVGTIVTVATAKSLAKESINELFSGYAPLSNSWYLVGMLTNKDVADYVDYQLLTFFYRAASSSWGCFARYRTEGSSLGFNHQSQIGNTSAGAIAVGDTYQIFAPEYLG